MRVSAASGVNRVECGFSGDLLRREGKGGFIYRKHPALVLCGRWKKKKWTGFVVVMSLVLPLAGWNCRAWL